MLLFSKVRRGQNPEIKELIDASRDGMIPPHPPARPPEIIA